MGTVTDPAKLCDLFLRRSTLQDDKTTLHAHERDLRERAVREGLTVRKVWKEELSAFKAGVKREEFDSAISAVLKAAGTIADELNAEGLTTRRGGRWRSSTITQLAHSPAWAGLMPVHDRYTDERGRERWRATDEPLTGPEGTPVRVGAGVITVGERARILAALCSRTSEGLATGRRGKPAAQSLLSGLLKCGRCGGGMTKGGPQYRCYRRVNMGKPACQGMTVLVEEIDSVLSAAFMSRVTSFTDTHELFQELARRWLSYKAPETDTRRTELTLALDNARSRLNALDDAFYVQGRFQGSEGQHRYEQMRGAIAGQISSVQNELTKIGTTTDLMILRDCDLLNLAWQEADLTQARSLLRVVLHSVRLPPPDGPGKRCSWYQLYARCCFTGWGKSLSRSSST